MTSARTHDSIHFFWLLDLHTFLCLAGAALAIKPFDAAQEPLDTFTAFDASATAA